jgi:hypothetical protein
MWSFGLRVGCRLLVLNGWMIGWLEVAQGGGGRSDEEWDKGMELIQRSSHIEQVLGYVESEHVVDSITFL